MQAGLELLKVSTNAPKQPTFDLTLAWKLKLPILAVPSRVVWDEPKIRGFKLEVKSRDGKPFRILETRIEGPKDKQGNDLLPTAKCPWSWAIPCDQAPVLRRSGVQRHALPYMQRP